MNQKMKNNITLRDLLWLMDSNCDGSETLKLYINEDLSINVRSDCSLYIRDEILDTFVECFGSENKLFEIWLRYYRE